MTFDPANGSITLYILGSDEQIAHAIKATPMTVRAKAEGNEDITQVELTPIPQPEDPKGRSSRFAGSHYELNGAKALQATVRIAVDGRIYRARYQIAPDESQQVYVCSMGCEKDKVYYKPGKCPICGMKLVKPGIAHSDHNPNHGGVLFMAPNRWHHLEGVLVSVREFRLYLYNNYTKPISAARFVEGSYAEVLRLDKNNEEIDKPVRLSFEVVDSGSYLKAAIPEQMALPLDIAVWLKFEGRKRPEIFNFTFKKVSGFSE